MTTSIDQAFRRLEAVDLAGLQNTGDWALGRMFNHLAQGVEFSMTGYPQQKPRLFQATIGTLAFKVFELRGRMSHGLDVPIPGEIVAEVTPDAGLGRLWASLEAFRDFDGPLQPHFAYGGLSKPKFATAHLFHIENHLADIGPRG